MSENIVDFYKVESISKVHSSDDPNEVANKYIDGSLNGAFIKDESNGAFYNVDNNQLCRLNATVPVVNLKDRAGSCPGVTIKAGTMVVIIPNLTTTNSNGDTNSEAYYQYITINGINYGMATTIPEYGNSENPWPALHVVHNVPQLIIFREYELGNTTFVPSWDQNVEIRLESSIVIDVVSPESTVLANNLAKIKLDDIGKNIKDNDGNITDILSVNRGGTGYTNVEDVKRWLGINAPINAPWSFKVTIPVYNYNNYEQDTSNSLYYTDIDIKETLGNRSIKETDYLIVDIDTDNLSTNSRNRYATLCGITYNTSDKTLRIYWTSRSTIQGSCSIKVLVIPQSTGGA